MSGSRLNKFFALLLTVNMIGSGVGIEVAAATAEDDGEEVVVSVDLSDHLSQCGAILGENEAEELRQLRPRFISGDYESFRAFIKHRRFSKNSGDPDAEDDAEEDVSKETDAEPVDLEVTEPEETKPEAEPEKTEPKETEPEETKPEASEPEESEPEAAEPEQEEGSPSEEPEEGSSQAPAEEPAEEPEEDTVTDEIPVYDSEAFSASNVGKLLNATAKNWDGKSEEMAADVTGMGVTPDNVSTAVAYFINTHGEYFYVSMKYSYSYNKNTNAVTRIYLYANSKYTKSDVDTFNAKVDSIMALIDPEWTDLEKALFLHDYLVTHCDYDQDTSNYHYDSYNCLVKGSCVCQGYSLTYDYLCRLAGVSCYYISSDDLNHAWNLVKIDGEEYFVDSTWDDPFYSSTRKPYYKAYCAHRHFLLSRNAMYNKGHESDDWMVDATKSAVKRGTDTKYDKFFWSSSISKLAPVSGHKWAYVTPNASKVMSFDFAKNSAAELGSVSLDYYSSVDSFKGDIYVSTASKVYKVDQSKKVSTIVSYTGSDGSIYGINVTGSKLYYYIYNGVTKYVKTKTCQLSADWKQVGNTWYYTDANGNNATGLTIIDDKTYLFDSNGAMLTGWQKVDGKKHYFRVSGEMVTGWELIDDKYYCFDSNGVIRTGFIKSGSTTYYCDPDGVRLTGWQQIGKYWYYFSSNKGKMATGWKTISKKQYFFSEKGIMRTGFRSIGGKTYYFTSKGVMKTGWFKKSGNDYYANSKGVVYMKKWKKTGGKWYYLGSDGIMLKSCTKKISGKKYKFNSKGVCTNKK